MSIETHSYAVGESRRSHLKLVASDGKAIPFPEAPCEIPRPGPTGPTMLQELLRGLALAGLAVHATPDSIRAQSDLLGGTYEARLGEFARLHRLKSWFVFMTIRCSKAVTLPKPPQS